VLAGYIGPHKIIWAADPHSRRVLPGVPATISVRVEPMSPKRSIRYWPRVRCVPSPRPVFPHQRGPLGFIEPLS
jgi:hypothetical protein